MMLKLNAPVPAVPTYIAEDNACCTPVSVRPLARIEPRSCIPEKPARAVSAQKSSLVRSVESGPADDGKAATPEASTFEALKSRNVVMLLPAAPVALRLTDPSL